MVAGRSPGDTRTEGTLSKHSSRLNNDTHTESQWPDVSTLVHLCTLSLRVVNGRRVMQNTCLF